MFLIVLTSFSLSAVPVLKKARGGGLSVRYH